MGTAAMTAGMSDTAANTMSRDWGMDRRSVRRKQAKRASGGSAPHPPAGCVALPVAATVAVVAVAVVTASVRALWLLALQQGVGRRAW